MARRTPRPVHDLLEQYERSARDIPDTAQIAAIDIDDPYHSDAHAAVTLAPRPVGSRTMDGPLAWEAPHRAQVRVVAALRDDVAAKMYARRQIDRACFMAARQYQTIHEVAEAARIRSCDLTATPVSGGRSDPAELIDAKAHATRELRRIETRLRTEYGVAGVHLVREILGRGLTIESAASARGELNRQLVRWWGGFFRRCLQFLAVVLGLATRHAYRRTGARPS